MSYKDKIDNSFGITFFVFAMTIMGFTFLLADKLLISPKVEEIASLREKLTEANKRISDLESKSKQISDQSNPLSKTDTPPKIEPQPENPNSTNVVLPNEWTKNHQNVEVKLLTTQFDGNTLSINLNIKSLGGSTYAALRAPQATFVFNGTLYTANTVSIGGKTETYESWASISPNTDYNAQIVFKGLPKNLENIEALSLTFIVGQEGTKLEFNKLKINTEYAKL